MIEFFAHGIPKGQPRPRAFARNGMVRVYDPGSAEGWKSAVAEAAKAHLPEKPLEGPVSVKIRFHFPRPKAHFTKKGLRPNATVWYTSKPDSDNAAKAILDALTVLGMWKDDSQVCDLRCLKLYAGEMDQPGAHIIIT